ncbi:hypothetical protein BJX70DRAFT_361806 [Aspergillus crustosus]
MSVHQAEYPLPKSRETQCSSTSQLSLYLYYGKDNIAIYGFFLAVSWSSFITLSTSASWSSASLLKRAVANLACVPPAYFFTHSRRPVFLACELTCRTMFRYRLSISSPASRRSW